MSDFYARRIQANKELLLGLWVERCLKEVTSRVVGWHARPSRRSAFVLKHLCDALASAHKMDVDSVASHIRESLHRVR